MKRTSLHPQVKHRRQLRRSQCLWHWPSVALSSPHLKRLGLQQRKVSQQTRAWMAAAYAQCWAGQIDQKMHEMLSDRSSLPPLLSDGKSPRPLFISGNTLESYGPVGYQAPRGRWGTMEDTRREYQFLVIGPTMLELRVSPGRLES